MDGVSERATAFDVVEGLARAIYDAMRAGDPEGERHPWIELGNSTRQDEARRAARSAIMLLAPIVVERVRQDKQWGGPDHDDDHGAPHWRRFRQRFESRIIAANDEGAFTTHQFTEVARPALVAIAALAVAQIESLDREVARVHELEQQTGAALARRRGLSR